MVRMGIHASPAHRATTTAHAVAIRERATAGPAAALVLGCTLALVTACTGDTPAADPESTPTDSGTTDAPAMGTPPTRTPADQPTSPPDAADGSPRAEATVQATPPPEFNADDAFDTVEVLAGEIGPREAQSQAFHEAADLVEQWFTDAGFDVTRVPVPVPAGDSWGVQVPAGESANVIADPPGFDSTEPHVVVGAHLDTVARAPGAEDNASGVAVTLELARLAAAEPPDIPVRFVAFGAEEPRGEGDDLHHFGSQQYVADMSADERSGLTAMVSLDRVGVRADHVPVCTGGTGTTRVRDELVEAADEAGVPTETCENRASDHWSFEKADLPTARLGSIPYAGYHSPDDVPSVVDTTQLDRVGRVMWAWLSTL